MRYDPIMCIMSNVLDKAIKSCDSSATISQNEIKEIYKKYN